MAAELAKFRVAFIIVSQLTLPLKCLFIQDGQLPERKGNSEIFFLSAQTLESYRVPSGEYE